MTFESRQFNPSKIQFIYGGVNNENNTPYWVDEINDSITIKWVESLTPPYFGNWFLEGYQPFQNEEITIISSDTISANPPIFGW